jgi:hypothetical protein
LPPTGRDAELNLARAAAVLAEVDLLGAAALAELDLPGAAPFFERDLARSAASLSDDGDDMPGKDWIMRVGSRERGRRRGWRERGCLLLLRPAAVITVAPMPTRSVLNKLPGRGGAANPRRGFLPLTRGPNQLARATWTIPGLPRKKLTPWARQAAAASPSRRGVLLAGD